MQNPKNLGPRDAQKPSWGSCWTRRVDVDKIVKEGMNQVDYKVSTQNDEKRMGANMLNYTVFVPCHKKKKK